MNNIDQSPIPNPESQASPQEVFNAIASLVEAAIDPDQEGLPDSFRDRIKSVHFSWAADTEGGSMTVDMSDTTHGIMLRYTEYGYGVYDSNYGRVDADASFNTTGKDLEFQASGYDPDEVGNRDLAPEDRKHNLDSSQVLARLGKTLPKFTNVTYSPSIRLSLIPRLEPRR